MTQQTIQASVAAGIIATSRLEQFVDSLTILVDECKLHVSDDGLQVTAVDPANVCQVDTVLDDATFDSFDPVDAIAGVQLDMFDDFNSVVRSDGLTNIELDTEDHSLLLEQGSVEMSDALVDTDSIREEPDMSNIELGVGATVDASELKSALKAADMVADTAVFEMDGNTLTISARGDTRDVDVTLDEDDLESVTGGQATTTYSCEYLKNLATSLPAGTTVTLWFDDDFPLELSYTRDFDSGSHEVTYMLAPRIQSSDE